MDFYSVEHIHNKKQIKIGKCKIFKGKLKFSGGKIQEISVVVKRA